jgi:hypothetical protein
MRLFPHPVLLQPWLCTWHEVLACFPHARTAHVRTHHRPTRIRVRVQWAKASAERNRSSVIVLMADEPKEELDDFVDELRNETGLEIMARSGLPYSLDDLDMVGAADAGTIVIMNPGHRREKARLLQ